MALVTTACVEDLSGEMPPVLDALAARYQQPTAALTPHNAADAVADIVAQRDRLGQLDDLRPLVTAMATVDDAVAAETAADEQNIRLKQIPLRADLDLTISAPCPGWPGDAAETPEAPGTIELQARVRDSTLTPVLWGQVGACHLEAPLPGGGKARVRFSAALAALLPQMLSKGDPLQLAVVDYRITELELDGAPLAGWSSSLRLAKGRLELLVPVDPSGALVGFVDRSQGRVGLRATNGEWICTPGQRRCDSSADPSASFSY